MKTCVWILGDMSPCGEPAGEGKFCLAHRDEDAMLREWGAVLERQAQEHHHQSPVITRHPADPEVAQ
jgi:hypothetical protein